MEHPQGCDLERKEHGALLSQGGGWLERPKQAASQLRVGRADQVCPSMRGMGKAWPTPTL